MMMRTAYRCRTYPDQAQQQVLARTFGCVRVVWNRTLAARHARYAAEGTRTSYAQTDRALAQMKKDPELAFLNEVSSVPLQQALRHINAAQNILAAGLAVARGSPGDACGAGVRHSGSSRVRPAAKQEPRPLTAGIPVLQGRE
jgi:transposase